MNRVVCHPLGVDFLAIDNRIVLFVATITNIEIEVSNVITTSWVDSSETLFELFVALTVEPSEEIVVFQAMFLFAWSDVVAVIMLATTLVNFWIAS